MSRFGVELGETSTQCLHDGREEKQLQYLRCRSKQWDRAVGVALVSWSYDGVLPNCRDINSSNWKVEELRQQGQNVHTKMAEVEQGEPIRPLGGGRARLPYGHCNASLVERPARGVHAMVAVEVPHELFECPIVLGRTGSKLPFEGLCNRFWARVGAALNSLQDERSLNIGEKAVVIPNITAGDMVSSGVAENIPEDFVPSRAGGWRWCLSESSHWLCFESLPFSLVDVREGTSLPRRGRGMTIEGDGYKKVVRAKVVRVDHVLLGRRCLLRKVISG